MQLEDIIVHNRNIGAPNSLITDATIIRTLNNSSSFSSDVELGGNGFGSFLCSGNEDVSGTVYPHCPGVESDCGTNGWGCSDCLDKTEKRALCNKAFLSLPEILCKRIN